MIKTVNFPENFEPKNCPVHARNEIAINAPVKDVWNWLIHVNTWPDWYPNSSNIKILNQRNGMLAADTQFKWRTFNTNITSTMKKYQPYEQLAWEAKGFGIHAYHGWLIVPKENSVQVITEETQNGLLPKLFGGFIQKGLLKQHQIWLEGLKKMSEA
ncbi:MAG: SRPBCC family protein [Croceivirga sp.]